MILVAGSAPVRIQKEVLKNVINAKTRKYIPIRKGFPKVYRYQKDGNDYFLVDGRSKTWGLKIRKNFNMKEDALKFAQEIEGQISEHGKGASNNQIYQN